MDTKAIKIAAVFTLAVISAAFMAWIAVSALQIGFRSMGDTPIDAAWNYFNVFYGG